MGLLCSTYFCIAMLNFYTIMESLVGLDATKSLSVSP